MAFAAQFSYSPPSSAALASPQIVLSSKSVQAQQRCLEAGRGLIPDGCTVGSPVSYLPRIAGLPENLYTQGVASTPPGIEPSAFYALGGAAAQSLAMDRSQELWKSIHQQSPVLYPFDPMLAAAHPYGAFYGGLDLNNAARRKNATRETTSALKAWLYEHRKNPYPTKGEKIMLAIITKMTLTQVSTWFANARRRLKKESKLGWNKDKDLDDNDSDIEIDDNDDDYSEEVKRRLGSTSSSLEASHDISNGEDDDDIKVTSDLSDISDAEEEKDFSNQKSNTPLLKQAQKHYTVDKSPPIVSSSSSISLSMSRDVTSQTLNQLPGPLGHPSPAHTKPKIWSIAEIMNTEREQEAKFGSPSSSLFQSHRHFPIIQHSRAPFSSLSSESIKNQTQPCEETALNLAVSNKPNIEQTSAENDQPPSTSKSDS